MKDSSADSDNREVISKLILNVAAQERPKSLPPESKSGKPA